MGTLTIKSCLIEMTAVLVTLLAGYDGGQQERGVHALHDIKGGGDSG